MVTRHRVVIVGGGFAGLTAARTLRKQAVDITLVDRRNFHLFQPLLYQVATGALSPANIAAPLRAILAKQANVRVVLGEAVGLDAAARQLRLADGNVLPYETLIVATGSRHHYFGKDAEWEPLAPGLKTLEDATEIRRRVLLGFEHAETAEDPAARAASMTFVVVGGGPTGVELVGALAEIARRTLRGEYDRIDPAAARIVLVENSARILGQFPDDLAEHARRGLVKLGVEIRTATRVTEIRPNGVTLHHGEQDERIDAGIVLWAAGVRGQAFGKVLADHAGATLDRGGRVQVAPDCTLPGHPEILVLGDLAGMEQDGKPLPGVAQVALQQGVYAAKLIADRLRGRVTPPFRYRDRGNMATIGRGHAIADLGWMHLSGFTAWLIWLFIHIMYIVGFQNRVLVLVQWAWAYLSRNRSARLITGVKDQPGT